MSKNKEIRKGETDKDLKWYANLEWRLWPTDSRYRSICKKYGLSDLPHMWTPDPNTPGSTLVIELEAEESLWYQKEGDRIK